MCRLTRRLNTFVNNQDGVILDDWLCFMVCRPRSTNKPDMGTTVNIPQPVQPGNGARRMKRNVGVVVTTYIPDIQMVKTKVVHICTTKFMLEVET